MCSVQRRAADLSNHFCGLLACQHSQPVGQPVNHLVTHGRSLNILHFCRGRPLQHFNLRLYETQRRLFLAICTIVSAHCRIALKVNQCPTITRHTSALCKALSQPEDQPGLQRSMRIRNVPLPQPHHIIPLRTAFSREICNSEPARLSVVFWAVASADCVLDEAGAVRRLLDLRVGAEAPNQRHARELGRLTR